VNAHPREDSRGGHEMTERRYTKPIAEMPELLRQVGYHEEAKRLEREFIMRKIERLVAEMKRKEANDD